MDANRSGPPVYFTRFPVEPEGGGGTRRVLQVLDLLAPFDVRTFSSPRRDGLPADEPVRIRRGPIRWWAIATLMGREWTAWSRERREAVLRLRWLARQWSRMMPDLTSARFTVVDDPVYFRPLVRRLRSAGVPVIAVCHNVETLCQAFVRPGRQRWLQEREVADLAGCVLAINISTEESRLLELHGIPARFFPYHPVEPHRSRLIRVRQLRKETAPAGGVLLLGSAKNPDTRHGMGRVIAAWPSLAASCGPLVVAGYDTEIHLAARVRDDSIRLAGSPLPQDLDDLLVGVRACLCYQEGGGGALTRIPEMLLAGVPVVANTHAARSFHGAPGLVEFDDLEELPAALARAVASGDFPPPDPPGVESLRAEILSRTSHCK